MTKKSKSKPMTQILERLCRFDYIEVVVFPEEVILEEPVDKWPLCDCLISFHSKGTVRLLEPGRLIGLAAEQEDNLIQQAGVISLFCRTSAWSRVRVPPIPV